MWRLNRCSILSSAALWFFHCCSLLVHYHVVSRCRHYVVVQAQDLEDALDATGTISRPVVVNLPDLGRVQGIREAGLDFFGRLPYAAPPVGTRRWAPPEPMAPWAPAKLDATEYGPDCWQLVDPLINPGADVNQMSEDCLYLNIHVPSDRQRPQRPLPVLVWLHGGAFQQGAARRDEYDGRRLAERGTVVVTLNYRLGALGFLVSSEDGLFGNFGLMDQRAALHWIQDNIAYFGGDPNNVMLFGESAGAVMTTLHLMMEGAGKLFHKVVIQSNPVGLQFRSIVVADFLGQALKGAVDCRDLACLRGERVEEIMRAQSSLMGVPRSVGDFFTWGPTLTEELKLILGGSGNKGTSSSRFSPLGREHIMFRDLDSWKWQSRRDDAWSTVNVTQPLKDYALIPDDIPIIIGSNKHEGEMFVHSAFPLTMSKTIYWMFVGALFRDSASRVLKHYRGYVDQIEREAEELARRQIEEEENRQYYFEHREELDREYQMLLAMNSNNKGGSTHSLFPGANRGGADNNNQEEDNSDTTNAAWVEAGARLRFSWLDRFLWFGQNLTNEEKAKRDMQRQNLVDEKVRLREQRKKEKAKARALKRAARVVVDYRPVMSRIIDDYLFRCPAWHLAHSISRQRVERGNTNNVYVYQFSHSTHIPGYKECWGKSCHTAEIPYVFEALEIIRTNYSTLGPYAQEEAPTSPEYPYTEMMAAYRGAMEAADRMDEETQNIETGNATKFSKRFQHLLHHFFGDYFKENADEEIARDMGDRWVAFAKSGDPNYDGSKAKWHPWRYLMDDAYSRRDDRYRPWQTQDFDRIFDLQIPQDVDEPVDEEFFVWSDNPEEQIYRRRALNAMGMEVVDEDLFRTMLKRKPRDEGSEPSYDPFPFGNMARNKENAGQKERARRAVIQLQQIAQDMGVIGTGLRGEPKKNSNTDTWEENFFPEIMELKWPPEGRLVERDCTCDLWDKIRYRY
ncbi:hypothetical protein ACA910_005947 [Epithemia clementina (nom. ined.)]